MHFLYFFNLISLKVALSSCFFDWFHIPAKNTDVQTSEGFIFRLNEGII